MNRKSTHGFTLMEILVVIAILAVIAAIAFPVFSRTRENARRATCQTNLRQIALSIQQYIKDNDSKYPRYAQSDFPHGPYGWADAIQPYLKSTQVLQCPTDTFPGGLAPNQSGYTDYYINSRLNTGPVGIWAGVRDGLNESAVQVPTVTVLLGDGIGGIPLGFTKGWSMADYAMSGPDNNTACTNPGNEFTCYGGTGDLRHFDGSNYAFADGHVKWLKPKQFFESYIGPAPIGTPANLNGYAATFAPY